jgi:hypothetical protein
MSYLSFLFKTKSDSGLTDIWDVYGQEALGAVSWYAPWRRYTYTSLANITLDPTCLREIADFCETQTQAHKVRVREGHGHQLRITADW